MLSYDTSIKNINKTYFWLKRVYSMFSKGESHFFQDIPTQWIMYVFWNKDAINIFLLNWYRLLATTWWKHCIFWSKNPCLLVSSISTSPIVQQQQLQASSYDIPHPRRRREILTRLIWYLPVGVEFCHHPPSFLAVQ